MTIYKNEQKKLLNHINNQDVVKLLKEAKCFIAGGAITSIFSDKEINDIDVYFRDYDSLQKVIKTLFGADEDNLFSIELPNFSFVYSNHTRKSILFTKDGRHIQLIYFKFFQNPKEIFDTFDFSVNMGAYDCHAEEFVLSDDFLKDIAQRKLRVNTNTYFPIISMLRIDKYRQKGYNISRKDFVNLCLAVNRLEINTWKEMADSIGGMYGYDYTDLFDTDKEFSINEAILQLESLESNLENYNSVNVPDCDSLLLSILNNLGIPIPEESFIFFKKVKEIGENNFTSYYNSKFKYQIGSVVNGGDNGIWAYKSISAASKHYTGSSFNHKIIELKVKDISKIKKEGNSYRLFGDIEVIKVV